LRLCSAILPRRVPERGSHGGAFGPRGAGGGDGLSGRLQPSTRWRRELAASSLVFDLFSAANCDSITFYVLIWATI